MNDQSSEHRQLAIRHLVLHAFATVEHRHEAILLAARAATAPTTDRPFWND